MIRLSQNILLTCFLLLCTKVSSAMLQESTFAELEKKIYKLLENNHLDSEEYVNEYLRRARSTGSKKLISKGFYFMLRINPKENRIYSDSLIAISKEIDAEYYPAFAYYLKAVDSYRNKSYSNALDYLVISDSILGKVDTVNTKYYVRQLMGLLKSRTGDYNGALKDFRSNMEELEKQENWKSYAYNAFAAYDVYLLNNQVDSADYYVSRAINNNELVDDKILVLLRMAKGIINYKNKDYNNAIFALKKSVDTLNRLDDYSNAAYCYFYMGKSFQDLDDMEMAVVNYEKVDSIFQYHSFIKHDLRSAYTNLISYYRDKNQSKKELYYLNSLIRLDSLSYDITTDLRHGIVSKYEMPKLLRRKDELLRASNENEIKLMVLAAVLLVVIMAVFALYFRNKRITSIIKKRYGEIKLELEGTKGSSDEILNVKTEIPVKYVDILENAFKLYDEKLSYLKKDFDKSYVKNDTGVNDHYISDYLRDYKGISFSTYINNKRIECAGRKILTDKQFCKYSMLGMAESLGYNNTSTFKRAFKERMGMTPLEFISQTENSSSNS